MSDCTEGKHFPEVTLLKKGKNRPFSQSADDFKNVYKTISVHYPSMLKVAEEKLLQQLGSYSDTSALILLPPVNECYGAATIVRNRPSFPLVYTTRGTFVAAAFSAECRHCTKNTTLATTRRCHRRTNDGSITVSKTQPTFKSLLRQSLKLLCCKTSPTTSP